MPSFDESTLRKAASWQDFKEAQFIYQNGSVTFSESTSDGWQGSLLIGKRTYKTSVIARTPTWFDAKCPCPASQREGKFCPHAIAIGLHLLQPTKPAQPAKPEVKIPSKISTPEIAWKILFQGPWQKTLGKGHAAICLKTSDHQPTPADKKITDWLISLKNTSSSTIQLVLNPQTLPEFLSIIEGHPYISGSDIYIKIDSEAQLSIADCALKDDTVQLHPGSEILMEIGEAFWKVTPESIIRIGNAAPSRLVLKVLTELASGKSAYIGKDRFVEHLNELQVFIDFSASEWFESLQFIQAKPEFAVSVSGSESLLNITFLTSYSQSLPSFDGTHIISQNHSAETTARTLLSGKSDQISDTSFKLSDPERIRKFLTKDLSNLPSEWKIELAPGMQKLATSYVFISPKIKILSSSDDSLEFDLTYQTDSGEIISASEVRRLIRSKNSSGNQRIILSDDIENLIDPLFEDLDIHQQGGRFTAKDASARIIQEISETLNKSDAKVEFHDSSQVIHNAPVNAELRPYQLKGFSWLVDRLTKYGGALLADDMGLGKTLQAITCIEHFFSTYSQSSPALIVVTTSLLGNWEAEFKRFAPNRRIIILHGTQRDLMRETIKPTDVILTTYSTLARDLAWHLRQKYSVAVIDEASLIRNPDTDHSKAVSKLDADYRIALTGTPVENSARDLWSIFRFIQPGWLGNRKAFQERYEIPLKAPETSQRTANLLRLKTSPFTLRRTKSEVAPELPSKIMIDEFCALSRDQLSVYREVQKEGLRRIDEIRASGQNAAARMQTLTTLLRLRQTCCDLALLDSEKLRKLPIPRRSSKLERLLEITEQSISSGSRLLIFSQFQKQLLEIGKALDELQISSIRLDGQTRNRQALVDQFQSSNGPPVFLISLKAGGYGLNLTAADVVVHFDPWWNPAAEAQATDRAHRIGQTKPVTIYRFLTRGTVEEKVVNMQATKKALADSLDETVSPIDAPAWSSKEIEKLLLD